jgi:hypothetical protein
MSTEKQTAPESSVTETPGQQKTFSGMDEMVTAAMDQIIQAQTAEETVKTEEKPQKTEEKPK